MALDDRDYLNILQHLQSALRQADSDLFERASQSFRPSDDPAESLLNYLRAFIHLISERSNRTYIDTLTLLNQYLRTEDNAPLSGIKVTLSETERSSYQVDEIDLSRVTDFEDVLRDLKALYDEIAEGRRSRQD